MAEEKYIEVGGRLHSIATGNVALGANEVLDDDKNKKQSDINAETDAALEDRYTKEQTYSKSELNNMITTPNQKYVTVTATDQTTDVTDVLPATGEADTVYRVGNWDGSQFDASVYSEYAWNGSQYIHLCTKTQIGEVFDISAYHATGGTLATYADLSAALDSNNGGGVPQSLQRGGMSVKYVRTYDNKYIQARCMAQNFTTDVTQWQGVDDKLIDESHNLIENGAVAQYLVRDVLDTEGTFYSFVVYDKNKNIGLGLTDDGKLRFMEPSEQFKNKLLTDTDYIELNSNLSELISFVHACIKNGNKDGFLDKNGYAAFYCDNAGIHICSAVGHAKNIDYPFVITDRFNNIGFAITNNGKAIFVPDNIVVDSISKVIKQNIIEEVESDLMSGFTPFVWAPKKVFALDGTTVQLFKQSLCALVDTNRYELAFRNLVNVTGQECGHNFYYCYEYDADDSLQDFSFTLGLYDKSMNVLALSEQSTTIVNVSKGESPVSRKNILCIGDSFTDADIWVSELRRLLTGQVSDGYSDTADSAIQADSLTNINFIGTKDTSASMTPNEGYGGQHYKFFATNASSPFINPSTGLVDFDYYMGTGNVKGSIADPSVGEKIDYAIILLGTNGNYQEQYVDAIWDGLLAHNPNIKVLIGARCLGVPFGCSNEGISATRSYTYFCEKAFEANQYFEAMCERNDYKNNFLYVDYNIRLDNLNNMPLAIVQANIRNSSDYAKIKRGQDNVHPKKEGYFQIADAFRGAFHYWCLNSNNL